MAHTSNKTASNLRDHQKLFLKLTLTDELALARNWHDPIGNLVRIGNLTELNPF